MNVVAQTRPIGRRVIGAENLNVLAAARRRVENERNQMGFGIVRLANRTVGRGARRVEITKRRETQAAGVGHVFQGVFDVQFGLAVGIDRVLWRRFDDR